MNEEEKKREIMQTEELIRQLAVEIARRTPLADQAEETRRSLEEASAAVAEAKKALEVATAAITASTDKLRAGTERLHAAAQTFEESPKKVAEVIDSRLNRLVSRVRWAMFFAILSALAVVGVGVGVLFLYLRTR